MIGNCPVLVVETMKIHEAIQMAIQMQLLNVIIESDSQVMIHSIMGKTKAPIRLPT